MTTLIAKPVQMKALIAGASQIRIPIEPQPDHFHRDIIGKPRTQQNWDRLLPQIGLIEIPDPYSVGQRVPVKEGWTHADGFDPEPNDPVWYRADRKISELEMEGLADWKSPASMPSWAVRFHLNITGVRGERVAEINEADAVKCGSAASEPFDSSIGLVRATAKCRYMAEWGSLFGKQYPAETAWCWVFDFDLERK